MATAPAMAVRRQEQTYRAWSPVLCLLAAVLMLGTVSPAIKYILQQKQILPLELACLRVGLAFVFLFSVNLLEEREELFSLTRADFVRLTLIGFLGVGLYYGLSVWSLVYTNVTHYILIYSLNPCFTAIISVLMKRDQASPYKIGGILLSLAGCMVAIVEVFSGAPLNIGIGDFLALVSTMLVSVYIVLSYGVVKKYGVLTANTVMFGTSTAILLLATIAWTKPSVHNVSLLSGSLIVYMGIATAAAFLLRYVSLKTLSPLTVGVFHYLVPVFAIFIAHLLLAEPLEPSMIVGGTMLFAGIEMVRRG
jgi:drug/metabolite transporter (DMT)-like permease